MRPATKHLLVALAFAVSALPAVSCGPDFPTAVFVLTTGPGGNYAAYAKGRLGIPQQPYRTRHLVLAFDYLTARPLTPAEQQQAIDVDSNYLNPWQNDPEFNPKLKDTLPPTGFDQWIAARKAFGPVDNYTPGADLALAKHSDAAYENYGNCLDNSFAVATKTLAARSTAYGSHSPAVVEWVRGQDAVYSNCGDGKPDAFFGPGKPPPPPLPPHPPVSLPAAAPTWLQQDRAYQIAAANLYASHFDASTTGFRAIAADTASPWSVLSRYLVARSLLRQATVPYDSQSESSAPIAGKPSAAQAHFLTALAPVQKDFLAMKADPRMTSLSGPIDDLLDFVNLRLEPAQQAAVLANRLHAANPRSFGQALIDLTYLRTNPFNGDDDEETFKPPPLHGPVQDTAGMLDWLDVMNRADEPAALTHWHATHQTVWLLAAISYAKPTGADAPALIAAAKALPSTDPAWIAINYHRLRLSPHGDVTRDQVLAVLPAIERSQTSSTVNLYTAISAATAPSLDTWLAATARKPADESDFQHDDEAPPPAAEDVCGTKIAPGTTRLFDTDAAYAFNHYLPLRLLAQAAETSTLPANLRYMVAQAAWVRAVLLDRPDIAHRMTPLLTACRPAWQPVLAAYDQSTDPLDRHATALLALMRFASTEPSVREGEERRNGFATYDDFRQNWWCTTVPGAQYTVDAYPIAPDPAFPQKVFPTPPPPPFLTPTDLAEAQTEVAALKALPIASTYFAHQALDFFHDHPNDPRTPDILGEANRVLRSSCRNDPMDPGKPNADPSATANLARQLFNILHQSFPESSWTKRYKSWE